MKSVGVAADPNQENLLKETQDRDKQQRAEATRMRLANGGLRRDS